MPTSFFVLRFGVDGVVRGVCVFVSGRGVEGIGSRTVAATATAATASEGSCSSSGVMLWAVPVMSGAILSDNKSWSGGTRALKRASI